MGRPIKRAPGCFDYVGGAVLDHRSGQVLRGDGSWSVRRRPDILARTPWRRLEGSLGRPLRFYADFVREAVRAG